MLRWHTIIWPQCHGGLFAFNAVCLGELKGLAFALRLSALLTLIVAAQGSPCTPNTGHPKCIMPLMRYGGLEGRAYPPG
jgi:hypothetical protein